MPQLLILLLLSSAAGAQVVIKSVCASGCDYTTTSGDFQRALNEAASFQEQGPSNCVDYIIEVDTSAKIVGNFTIPNKSCQAFVTIRSNRMDALPGRGTRIDPAVHAEFMPTFEAARVAGSSSPAFATIKNGGTRYWRFKGLNVYAGDSLYA